MATRGMVRCGACAERFPAEKWLDLSLVETLGPRDLGAYVSSWPSTMGIEVRRCSGCGRGIARTCEAARLRAEAWAHAPDPGR